MRASLLCYPATRFESGSEFVVFVLFYWQQQSQITIYPTSPRLGKLVRASTIDQVEKAMLMVIWVKLWYCITKILELCDEFIPGDPPEFFFDRWFWQLLVRNIFNQISKKICISYFVSASFFFQKNLATLKQISLRNSRLPTDKDAIAVYHYIFFLWLVLFSYISTVWNMFRNPDNFSGILDMFRWVNYVSWGAGWGFTVKVHFYNMST